MRQYVCVCVCVYHKEKHRTLLQTSWEDGLEVNSAKTKYDGVSKSFRTGRLERELQMVTALCY